MDITLAMSRIISTLESSLTDPISSSRVGSYVFGPDQELNFNRMTPKVQVTDNNIAVSPDTKSFGQPFQKTKEGQIYLFYYNKKTDTYSETGSTYKGRSYNKLFIQKMEDLVGSNLSNMGLHGMMIGEVDRVQYNPNQQIYVGLLPLTFQWRR